MMISDTENQPLSPNKNSSGNSGRNDLIIKLVFPPSSSIRSKFMFVQENQKVSDIVDYATQLAGLNPGYSLQLSASPTTGRPQWLDDDQLLISYSIPTSVCYIIIFIYTYTYIIIIIIIISQFINIYAE